MVVCICCTRVGEQFPEYVAAAKAEGVLVDFYVQREVQNCNAAGGFVCKECMAHMPAYAKVPYGARPVRLCPLTGSQF